MQQIAMPQSHYWGNPLDGAYVMNGQGIHFILITAMTLRMTVLSVVRLKNVMK
uniref:Uncharacterized protein n=1 Tax=Anguilla anguilla TaxID=7936 RepID=A0A0E9SBL3_ANGAN